MKPRLLDLRAGHQAVIGDDDWPVVSLTEAVTARRAADVAYYGETCP